MGSVLRITNWRIVRKAMMGDFTLPFFPSMYEYRGNLVTSKGEGVEILVPKLKSFNPSNLTGIGKKGVRFIFQEPNSEWLKFLKRNNISIEDYKF